MKFIELPLIPRSQAGAEFRHHGDEVHIQVAHIVSVEEWHSERCTVRTLDGMAYAVAKCDEDVMRMITG